MILDASALIAILRDESEALRCANAIDRAESVSISAVNFVEAAILVDRSGDAIARRRFDELREEIELTIEAVTAAQASIAREAYRDFGKGSGHPAGLNFGDCFAYALAKSTGKPLLATGTEFTRTDVRIG